MTEEEAKTKWCPMYRITYIASVGVAGDNRGKTLDKEISSHCIGSECMAFRFRQEEFTPKGSDPFATRKPIRDSKDGYCGLAR